MDSSSHLQAARALAHWYVDAGVGAPVEEQPVCWYEAGSERPAPAAGLKASRPITHPKPADGGPAPADEALEMARAAAARCNSLGELGAAIAGFNGCPLKEGARSTVFIDGTEGADLLIIGEAPGRDEDAVGKPFVGRAGKLLDKMLASIGRSRGENTLISNVVFWRPPGNRAPTQMEIALCRPFVDRLIELARPRAIALAGGVPTQALTGQPSIMRARGVWRRVETAGGAAAEVLPMFHPAFLLRQPAQKRLAWADLMTLEKRLKSHD